MNRLDSFKITQWTVNIKHTRYCHYRYEYGIKFYLTDKINFGYPIGTFDFRIKFLKRMAKYEN